MGNDEILPHRDAQLALAIIGRDVGQRAHLLRTHPPNGNTDADRVETTLRLLVYSEPAVLEKWPAGLASLVRQLYQRKGQFLLRLRDEFLDAPFFEQVLQPRFFAVTAA